jgi:hypothetical protein
MNKTPNLAGQKFGMLEVLERSDPPPGITADYYIQLSFWRCRCDCGREVIRPTGSLNNKSLRSCKPCVNERRSVVMRSCWSKLPNASTAS